MGLFDTTTTTNSKTSGTATTGITGTVLNYANSLGGIYNPSNYAGAWAGIDPYQQAAAANQQGLSAGLTPAYNQALSIGATGIDPNRIAAFYNPATQGMVDATNRSLDRTDAIGRARDQAWMAKQGALGGTQGRNNRMMGDFSRDQARASTIAGLYSDAWKNAAGLAGQSAGLQLSGLGAAGTISGAQSGLNQGLFQMGSGLQQLYQYGNLLPYQLATQGAQTYAGIAPATGQYTTGKSSGTSTSSPSTGSIIMGGIGAGLSAFSDARIKDNIKVIGETFDGQPIYKYNFKGSPKTEIGLMAQDVEQRDPEAVSEANGIKMVDYDRATEGAERKAGGGGVMAPYQGGSDVKDPHSRLMKAFHSIRGMMRSNGGPVIKPFADGGDVGGLSGMFLPGANIMDKVPNAGKALTSAGTNMQKQADDANNKALSSQQSGLSQMMSGMMLPAKGFAGGGLVNWTGQDETWASLSPTQRAAAMALMEADGRNSEDARNALGAMINRALKSGEDLGSHVSRSIYQPTIEPAQRARLGQLLSIPEFKALSQWADARLAGQEADPVNGATHFLAHEPVMERLTAREPNKYRSWKGWTGYSPETREYRDVLLRDKSHAFLAPEGRYVDDRVATPQPPDGMDAASYASKSVIPAYAAAPAASPSSPVEAAIKPYAAAETASPITPPADPAKEKSFGDTMKSLGSKLGDLAKPHEDAGAKALAEQQSSLSRMLAGMMLPAKGFASGGTASGDIEWVDGQPVFPASSDAGPSYAGGPKETDITSREPGVTISPLTPSSVASRGPIGGSPPEARSVAQAASSSGFNWKSLMPFQGGVWNGEAMTPMQRAGAALMMVGNGPFSPMGNAVLEMNKHRLEQEKENRALASLMGRLKDGTPTFEAQEKSGLISLNGKTVPTLDKQKLDDIARVHDADIAVKEKMAQNEGLKINPLTGDYYSADPKSPFYPQVSTPDPDAGMSAAVRKAWAQKVAPEQIGKLSEAYNAANDTVNKFNDMESLLPNMITGKWAGPELEGRKILARLGFTNADKIAATEIGRALSQTLILDATKNLKPASNLDLQFTSKATATIENDPATLQVLLPGLRAAAQRSQLKAELELKEVKAGRIPDTVAIDKAVDSTIPSPFQAYAERLKLGNPGATSNPSIQRVSSPSSAEPPQDAVNMLLSNASDPIFIASFNKKFNAGKPGLAETKIAEARMSKVGSAPQPPDGMDAASYASKSAGPATPDTSNEYAPHNLLRRLFGQNPI